MIWLILLLGFILRLISLNQSLWLDEAINVLAAKNYSLLGMIFEYAKADFHPPGWFILLWFWTKVFGFSEIAVRIPSVIFGTLTIWVVFLLGKKLVSNKLGILAAFLIAINPLHIYYSQEARMYALATLAVSINIFLIIKSLKGEKVNYLILVISNFLVLMSDYVAYFIFPAQLIFLLILKRKAVLKQWSIGLICSVLLFLWWVPIFLSQLNVGAVAAERLPAWKFIVGGFDFKAVPLTIVKFIIGRISYTEKKVYGLILLPLVSLFSYLLWRGLKSTRDLEKNLFLTWMLVPIISAFLISLFIPIYSYFRLLFTLPAFIMLVALGIFSFKSKIRLILLSAVVLIELVSTFIYLFNPLYQRDDWKGLVNFLKSKQQSITLFESSGTLPPFDYYAKGGINAKGALKDFPAKKDTDVVDLGNVLQEFKNIYLVEYLVDISDPQRLVERKLNELDYTKINTYNFTGVGFVYHYVKE